MNNLTLFTIDLKNLLDTHKKINWKDKNEVNDFERIYLAFINKWGP